MPKKKDYSTAAEASAARSPSPSEEASSAAVSHQVSNLLSPPIITIDGKTIINNEVVKVRRRSAASEPASPLSVSSYGSSVSSHYQNLEQALGAEETSVPENAQEETLEEEELQEDAPSNADIDQPASATAFSSLKIAGVTLAVSEVARKKISNESKKSDLMGAKNQFRFFRELMKYLQKEGEEDFARATIIKITDESGESYNISEQDDQVGRTILYANKIIERAQSDFMKMFLQVKGKSQFITDKKLRDAFEKDPFCFDIHQKRKDLVPSSIGHKEPAPGFFESLLGRGNVHIAKVIINRDNTIMIRPKEYYTKDHARAVAQALSWIGGVLDEVLENEKEVKPSRIVNYGASTALAASANFRSASNP